MKKIIIIATVVLALVAAVVFAAPIGRWLRVYYLVVYTNVTGSTDWRTHAHSNGGADIADTVTFTGAVAGGYAYASWHGVVPGTQALACSVGTDKVITYCLAVDTALFRTTGYDVLYIK
jgi:hypothetical protein